MRLDVTGIDPVALQEAIRKAGFAPSSPVVYALTFTTEEPVTIRSPEPITLDSWSLPRPFNRADFGLRWTSHEKQRRAIEGYNGILRQVFLDIIYPPAGFIYSIKGELVQASKTKVAKKRRRIKKHENLERLKQERIRVELEAKEAHQKALEGAGIQATLGDILEMFKAAKTPAENEAAQRALAALADRERAVVSDLELRQQILADEERTSKAKPAVAPKKAKPAKPRTSNAKPATPKKAVAKKTKAKPAKKASKKTANPAKVAKKKALAKRAERPAKKVAKRSKR